MKKRFSAIAVFCLGLLLLTGAAAGAWYWPEDDGIMPMAGEQEGHPAHEDCKTLKYSRGQLFYKESENRTMMIPCATVNISGTEVECYILGLPQDEPCHYCLESDIDGIDLPILIAGTVDLCLNGHTIRLQSDTAQGAVIKVVDGAVIKASGSILENINVASPTLNLYDCQGGGTITGGESGTTGQIAPMGGGVLVFTLRESTSSHSTFNMYGGSISNNTGSGICSYYSDVHLYGGTISENTGIQLSPSHSDLYGGGVYFMGYGGRPASFTMSGGTIQGNTATPSENTADSRGGGIYFQGLKDSFQMTGGKILDNKVSSYGGGIYLVGSVSCRMEISGGVISGNSIENTVKGFGAGVLLTSGCTCTISGDPEIRDNVNRTVFDESSQPKTEDFCLDNGSSIILDDSLSTSANIGVYKELTVTPGSSEPISQLNGPQLSEDHARAFTWEGESDYTITWNDTDNCIQVTNPGTDGRHIHDMSVECDETEDKIEFRTAITQEMADSGITLAGGRYYLAEDITLTKGHILTNGNVDLCLNGHVIRQTGEYAVIRSDYRPTLNLCDCHPEREHTGLNLPAEIAGIRGGLITGGKGYKEGSNYYGGGGLYFSGITGSNSFNMYGGTIAGNHAVNSHSGGVFVSGDFNLHGGTITLNTADECGGGVQVQGSFNMLGGEITNNTAKDSHGGLFFIKGTNGSISMSGGKITGNSAGRSPGGAAASLGCNITVSGTPEIYDNMVGTTPNNFQLYNNRFIIGEGGLQDGTQIGVSLSFTGQAAPITSVTSEPNLRHFFADDSDNYHVYWDESTQQIFIAQGGMHQHADGNVFQKITNLNATKLTTGNYYLPSGSTWSPTDTITIEGTVRLCLNGSTVTAPAGKPVFTVPEGSTLYLSACSNTPLADLINGGSIQIEQGGTLILIENKSANDSTAAQRTISAETGPILTEIINGEIAVGHQRDHNGVQFFDQVFDTSTPGTLNPGGPNTGSLPIHPELYYDLPAGNYYMTEDVEMQYAMEVHDITNFCLFDHDLTAYNETWEYDMNHVFWVPDKSVLNVYDCMCDLKIVWLYGGSVHLRGSGQLNLITDSENKITMEVKDGADGGGTFTFAKDSGDVTLPPHSEVTQTSGGKTTTTISNSGEQVVITPLSGGGPDAAALELPQTAPPVRLIAPENLEGPLTLELPSDTSIQAQITPEAHVVLNSSGTIDTAGSIIAEEITVSAPDKQEEAAVIAAPEGEKLKASVDGTVDLPANSTVTTGEITLELKPGGDGPSPTGQFKAGGEIELASGSEITATITETSPSGEPKLRTIVIALPDPGEGAPDPGSLHLKDGEVKLPAGSTLTTKNKEGKTIVIALPYPDGGGDLPPVKFDEKGGIVLPEGTEIRKPGSDGSEDVTITTPENNTLDPDSGNLKPADPDNPDNPDNPGDEDKPTDLSPGTSFDAEDGTKIEFTDDQTITVTPPDGEDPDIIITLPEQKPGDPPNPAPKVDAEGNVYIEGPFEIKTGGGRPKIEITPAETPDQPKTPVTVTPDGKVELPDGGKIAIQPEGERKEPIVIDIPDTPDNPIDLKPEDGKIILPPDTTVTVGNVEYMISNEGGSVDMTTGKVANADPDDPGPGPDNPPPQPDTPTPGNPGGSNKPGKPNQPSEPDAPDESQGPGSGEGSGGPCPRDETCPIWPYTDAVPTAWYHDGVHYCIEETLMIGTAPALFEPDIPLTRAMVTQVLYNRAGRPQVSGEDPFTDVKAGAWYWPAITWAAKGSVVLGYGDGRFGPNDPVTREQLAAMLWRDAGRPASQYILTFSDAHRISDYALPALRWTTQRKIVNGYPDGTFLPQGNATRAEAAQMFYRYFNR